MIPILGDSFTSCIAAVGITTTYAVPLMAEVGFQTTERRKFYSLIGISDALGSGSLHLMMIY